MAVGVRGAMASAQNWLDGGKVQGCLSPEMSFGSYYPLGFLFGPTDPSHRERP